MEFKNINQLKKEIEELKKKKDIVGTNIAIWTLYHELKAKLQTLQNVCEEIRKIKVMKDIEEGDEPIQRNELLKKFQGEEE